jgi:hypothetical protein
MKLVISRVFHSNFLNLGFGIGDDGSSVFKILELKTTKRFGFVSVYYCILG